MDDIAIGGRRLPEPGAVQADRQHGAAAFARTGLGRDDLGPAGSWVRGLDQATWLSPRPLGQGARRSLRIGRLITIQEEYYSWKELDHMTFRVTDVSRPILRGWVEDMRLQPLPDGGTRLSWVMALDSWLLRRVRIPRILQPAVDRLCRRMISGITTILPEPAPATSSG